MRVREKNMPRLPAIKTALFAVLSAATLIAFPATALAATTAPAAIVHPQSGGVHESYIMTFPDTQAGLTECNNIGVGLITEPGSKYFDYQCIENNPNPGYNLWGFWSDSNCNTCIKPARPATITRHSSWLTSKTG
jgi:hypothetical protein